MISSAALIVSFLARIAVAQFAQVSRTGWTITVDSFESTNPAANAIDGSSTTFWHSEYSPVLVPLPHNLTIDMKANHFVNGFTYLPRQVSQLLYLDNMFKLTLYVRTATLMAI